MADEADSKSVVGNHVRVQVQQRDRQTLIERSFARLIITSNQKSNQNSMRRSGGTADAVDSKSTVGDNVRVQIPSPALILKSYTKNTILFR